MTLTVGWVRKVGRVSELVFASDSRLRFGAAWDCCPKLFTLPRSDCLISFAGDTHYTYPLLLQMINSMAFFSGSRTRRLDLARVKGHTLRIFNQMHDAITDLPKGAGALPEPDALFLFGGYSWRHDDFRLWTIHYQQRQFTFAPSLSVWPHNTAAIALYRKYGFVEEGRRLKQIRRQSGELWDVVDMGLLL